MERGGEREESGEKGESEARRPRSSRERKRGRATLHL